MIYVVGCKISKCDFYKMMLEKKEFRSDMEWNLNLDFPGVTVKDVEFELNKSIEKEEKWDRDIIKLLEQRAFCCDYEYNQLGEEKIVEFYEDDDENIIVGVEIETEKNKIEIAECERTSYYLDRSFDEKNGILKQ
jgi:hypothetical protein